MDDNSLGLGAKFFRVNSMLHQYRHYSKGVSGFAGEVGRGQGRVLTLLQLQPEISQRQLCYLLSMRPQSLGELLTKLENCGYIVRNPSESDQRAMTVTLTSEGLEAAKEVGAQRGEFMKIFDCLNDGEKSQMSEFLDKITAEIEKKIPDEAETPFSHHSSCGCCHKHER